jgi:hypothetical protein
MVGRGDPFPAASRLPFPTAASPPVVVVVF